MFNSFNLAAIVRGLRGSLSLALISMDRHLQSELASSWWQQYRTFTEGVDEVDIDIGYKPDAHERFVVRDYDLPKYLQKVDSRSMLPVTTMQAGDLDNIVALCGVVSSDDSEYLLFQKFRRPQVIKPGLTLLLQGDTYHSIERPGLTLDRKICAVFSRDDSKLIFSTIWLVNSFLPLVDYYTEGSIAVVNAMLGHYVFAPGSGVHLATRPNRHLANQCAKIVQSGILNKKSATEIIGGAANYGVSIRETDGRIVIPDDRKEARELLRFLNEEIYRGPLTNELFETNSKRRKE